MSVSTSHSPSPSSSPPGYAVAGADPGRWPDVVRAPHASRLRTGVAERLVRHALARLPLRVRLAGREDLGLGGPLMDVRDPATFFRRIGADGLIGFGESYMAGERDSPDPVGVLTVLAGHVTTLIPQSLQRLRGLWAPRRPAGQLGTHEGARDNVSHHYDLSNELFALFLDETLSYSSALFRGFPAEPALLPAAQHRKIDRLLDLAAVGPGTELLEIGTGWGELAIRAAARGARVVSVMLSREQRDLARRRIRDAGFEDCVDVRLCDYRDVEGVYDEDLVEVRCCDYRDIDRAPGHEGGYDAVSTIEMGEHVGDAQYPAFAGTLHGMVRPRGRVLVQQMSRGRDAPGGGARSSSRTSRPTCTCVPSARPWGCWRVRDSKCVTWRDCASTTS